ncbi:MAG: hypothetical protein IKS72_00180 [Prevotella sp.]|nr:hypothetical protein [Prevotella sp.]
MGAADQRHVEVAFPSIAAAFSGELQDGQIVGTFRQMGRELPLTLKPGDIVRQRPNTTPSKKPFRRRFCATSPSGLAV